jgi:hypothetical protein
MASVTRRALESANKKPRSVSGGANLSFFNKRGNCEKVAGYNDIIIIGSGSFCFCSYFSSGV